MSTVLEYGKVAKFLHWIIGGLIILQYLGGISLDFTGYYWLHIQSGCLILVLVICRILWRITQPYPKADASLSRSNQIAAASGHGILYLLIFAIPALGLFLVLTKGNELTLLGIHIPALFTPWVRPERHIIKEWHEWLAHLMIICVAGHVLAALAHQFIHRRPILSRMLPKCLAKYLEQ
jgi:cytochrome b561